MNPAWPCLNPDLLDLPCLALNALDVLTALAPRNVRCRSRPCREGWPDPPEVELRRLPATGSPEDLMTTTDPRKVVDSRAVAMGGPRISERLAAYVALTKPRIIELLLVTTLPVMFLAAGGLPDLWLVVATLVGGTLAAGSANALNCYFDRDIDERMRRTRRRPLPAHAVSPRRGRWSSAAVLGVVATRLARAHRQLAVRGCSP